MMCTAKEAKSIASSVLWGILVSKLKTVLGSVHGGPF